MSDRLSAEDVGRCTHRNVVYAPANGGRFRDRWECASGCGATFIPTARANNGVLLNEIAALRAELAECKKQRALDWKEYD